jgi:hypothetical protein
MITRSHLLYKEKENKSKRTKERKEKNQRREGIEVRSGRIIEIYILELYEN